MEKVENAVILTVEEYEELTKKALSVKKVQRRGLFRSITRYLFVTSQVAALLWVSVSYGIAVYATIALGQPFPVETLSESAITTLLGVSALKVIENIFEHNNGVVWGTSAASGDSGDC